MGKGGSYPAWSEPIEAVAAYQGTDLQVGLTEQQIAAKREQYGFNELEKQPGKPLWKLVLEQFDDMLVKVCSAACTCEVISRLPSALTHWQQAASRVVHKLNPS